jgi:hypothetical protein
MISIMGDGGLKNDLFFPRSSENEKMTADHACLSLCLLICFISETIRTVWTKFCTGGGQHLKWSGEYHFYTYQSALFEVRT